MSSTTIPSTVDILQALIAFDTTSRNPNRALIDYVAALLNEHGINSTIIADEASDKANLYCTVGPENTAGIMLSGHTDVVPVDGQNWSVPAFELTEKNNKYYGRGTTDMKGFVASAIRAALIANTKSMTTPLHLGFSYDEEIGCVGVRSLLDTLNNAPVKPAMCIVGEPTSLKVATKHKGKSSIVARCIGKEGHSALAPNALNAIHLATDLVNVLREQQETIKQRYKGSEELSEVPYTTVHVGRINADQALNIVPNLCTVNFEIRHTAQDNPVEILNAIKSAADDIVIKARQQADTAAIEFDVWNAYPGLDTPVQAPVVEFVKSLVGANDTSYVAFGTEGGLFSAHCGIPTVVCGPGSMQQGHKPDEFIEQSQLQQCDDMLDKLVEFLALRSLPD
jgi:acetylornithine deacetylase